MASSVLKTKARVGWNNGLGTTMRLRLELTPSIAGSPLTNMTKVASVQVHVQRSDGTTSTWTCSILGVPTANLAVWTYVYGPTDLPVVDSLYCTALMTTDTGAVVPSEPFGILVED